MQGTVDSIHAVVECRSRNLEWNQIQKGLHYHWLATGVKNRPMVEPFSTNDWKYIHHQTLQISHWLRNPDGAAFLKHRHLDSVNR